MLPVRVTGSLEYVVVGDNRGRKKRNGNIYAFH